MRRPSAVGRVLGLAIVCGLLLSGASARGAVRELHIGVLLHGDPEACRAQWQPLADYLTRRLPDLSFRIVPVTSEEMDSFVGGKRLAFVLVNPGMYVFLAERHGVEAIATVENMARAGGTTLLGGVILRRSDREDLRDLASLKGKPFMAHGPDQFGGWITVLRELTSRGVQPADFASMRFCDEPTEIVESLLSGRADAGSMGTREFQQLVDSGALDLRDFRIFALEPPAGRAAPFECSTRLYPEWAMARVRHVSPELAQRVSQALQAMPATDPVVTKTGVRWSAPLSYAPVREALRELGLPPYDTPQASRIGQAVRTTLPWLLFGGLASAAIVALLVYVISLRSRLSRSRRELEARLVQHSSSAGELHRHENLCQALLDNVSYGIFLVDADRKILRTNLAGGRLLGADPAALAGRPFDEVVVVPDGADSPVAWAIASRQVSEAVLDIDLPGGERRVVKVDAIPVFDDRQIVSACLAMVEDLSGRQRMESDLRESEKRFQSLFHRLGEGFCLCELVENAAGEPDDFRIVEINPAMLDIIGHPRENVVGRNIGETMPELLLSDSSYWLKQLTQVTRTGRPLRVERHDPVLRRWLEVIAFSPTRGQVALLCQDITQRRLAEEALAEARAAELRLGSRIQKTLLLGESPRAIDGADLATIIVPSKRIEGDFHEFVRYDEHRFDVLLGDVMMEGTTAAMLAAGVKLEFHRALNTIVYATGMTALPTPVEVIAQMHRRTFERLASLDACAGLCYARFHLDEPRVDFVQCGYTDILHYHTATGQCERLSAENVALGANEQESYRQRTIRPGAGDLLLMHSDGVVNATNADGEPFGPDRLADVVRAHARESADEIVQAIYREVTRFVPPMSTENDITCIAVRLLEARREVPLRADTLTIASRVQDLVRLREFVGRCLGGIAGADEDFVSQLELAVSEAAATIMQRAYAGATDQAIEIAVNVFSDEAVVSLYHSGKDFTGPQLDTPVLDGEVSEGTAMFLVRNCVDELSFSPAPDGRHGLHLTKRLPRPPAAS